GQSKASAWGCARPMASAESAIQSLSLPRTRRIAHAPTSSNHFKLPTDEIVPDSLNSPVAVVGELKVTTPLYKPSPEAPSYRPVPPTISHSPTTENVVALVG